MYNIKLHLYLRIINLLYFCILKKDLLMKEKNEIVLFENQSVKLEVNMNDETVWLHKIK